MFVGFNPNVSTNKACKLSFKKERNDFNSINAEAVSTDVQKAYLMEFGVREGFIQKTPEDVAALQRAQKMAKKLACQLRIGNVAKLWGLPWEPPVVKK